MFSTRSLFLESEYFKLAAKKVPIDGAITKFLGPCEDRKIDNIEIVCGQLLEVAGKAKDDAAKKGSVDSFMTRYLGTYKVRGVDSIEKVYSQLLEAALMFNDESAVDLMLQQSFDHGVNILTFVDDYVLLFVGLSIQVPEQFSGGLATTLIVTNMSFENQF